MNRTQKVCITLVLLFIVVSVTNSQYIQVQNNEFKVVNYTLVEDILSYRVYDHETGECTYGGGMNYFDYYTYTFFASRKGKYIIEIYQGPHRVLIREIVEVK